MDKNKLLLIDGSSVAFRAFFALYNQIDRFKSPAGLHTNAIYGFNLMLDHMMKRIEPTHILVAFDAGKTTFRTELYADYKAGRAKTPDEFREQFPFIRQMLDAMGIKHYELDQYEADDIIGTLDKMAERADLPFEVTIVSGDKDLIQLTDENTVVEISKKGVAEFEEFTPAYLMEKMGITPTQFIDLKALMGDKSDNIPGVTKIGEKTGLKLLTEFGSLDGIYENIDRMKPSKMKENLIADKESAFLSRTLATIDTQAPIEIGLDDVLYSGPKVDELGQFYDDMGFKQLRAQLGSSVVEEQMLEFQTVSEVSSAMLKKDQFFYFEILGENYHREDLVGLAWGDKDGIYVGGPELLDSPILREFLEKETIKTYDFKRGKVLLARKSLHLCPATFDSRLAKYLLSTVEDNALTTIANLYGQTSLLPDEAVYGKGAKLALPEREEFFPHLARKVQVLVETEAPMLAKLKENQQLDLLFEMELPLANVLAKMEIAGIKVEADTLKTMQEENEVLIDQLTKEIYELAGREFNINSPKQLGSILFEEMGLPLEYTKKTKTGYSTAVDVLERLAPIVPVVSKILEYRQITKLQSTYVIGLQDAILEDGKIHTRYVQDLTQTGRLSSTDPNLQNIPVRLAQGRLIRKAFVPSLEDSVLLASDYSQIELRVLAHISQDQHLIEAFQQGADIHTSTAMRVFGIEKVEDVTANDRRNAKAVNFGVVYGISDFGLSNNLGISRKEAKAYIDTYFERFPGIKNYMETIVREARDKGFVETLYKRRRELPDINSRNFNVRNFAERTAINSPIQGSAADILKVAMIRLDRALTEAGLATRMLLQVHDEIVLEVPKSELEVVKTMVKEIMESAINLSVPLIVDENEGQTWYEAK
ncbi:DNA polymerase I [Streptococcus ruminantium]|uniref:DNA polymerase I n=1 Tax=Streptococcus ruminantium TaxID=1917441 RepID=A0ABU1B5Q2_9STRE|nr:DNA polymerase I [Streptococcus ruminantium]MDQ8759741.1 DNA polymerase I [Streptococcus ruminantium]MDQ8765370.1 DNA polymerase I [Streptococcus ruminantium]MDQ8766413.1 DNA polymerase I [Streptococcus ruminantium]MDQ8769704.1 DNA polymerase I [Streptococcus ruminantium]MDQ8775617.1 DNA polymerase I [Streptococcus ruminantium]